ncbi:hypothetical protein [Kibdelosporangium philippinense]|uniref:hypothetical protein n=1 Tax=Kibdelosporangium philippinense TaxID=211113 RepID=UPI00361A3201
MAGPTDPDRGGPLPPGQIELMREQAVAYRAYAQRVLSAGEGLQRLVDGVGDSVSPEVAEKFRVHMAELNDGRGQALAEIANLQAWKLDEQATNIDSGRYGIYVQVVWTVSELAYIAASIFLWATWPFVFALGQLMVRLVRMGISYKTAAIIAARIAWEGVKRGADNVAVTAMTQGFDDFVKVASKGLGDIPTSGFAVPKLIKQIPPDNWWYTVAGSSMKRRGSGRGVRAGWYCRQLGRSGPGGSQELGDRGGYRRCRWWGWFCGGSAGRKAGLKGSTQQEPGQRDAVRVGGRDRGRWCGDGCWGFAVGYCFGVVNSTFTDP